MKSRWSYNSNSDLCWQARPLSEHLDLSHYQSAFYAYDLSYLKTRANAFMANAPENSKSFYALKANSHPEILKTLKISGFGLDVVSRGEIEKGLEAGFLGQEMIYSGVGKTRNEIEFAIKNKIHQFNVESLPELERISELAKKMKISASIVLRVNPEVEVDTHPYIATGLRENKFGIEVRDLQAALPLLKNAPHLQFKGLSMHIGSQLFDLKAIEDSILKLIQIKKDIEDQGLQVERMDVGGGLGIHYEQDLEDEEHKMLENYMALVQKHLGNFSGEIQFEPGRWIVGHAGFLISQVQYLKKNSHKVFVILDSGMNHLIRPSLYQAYHEIFPMKKRGGSELVDVVGPICESSDILAANRNLTELRQDDLVVIADAGAYGFSMASQYNSHELPVEVFFESKV